MNENSADQHVWIMEEDARDIAASQNLNIELQIQKKNDSLNTDDTLSVVSPSVENNHDDRAMIDGAIINSQESVTTDEGQTGSLVGATDINTEKMPLVVGDSLNTENMQDDGEAKVPQAKRRRSERLNGVIHLTMLETNAAIA